MIYIFAQLFFYIHYLFICHFIFVCKYYEPYNLQFELRQILSNSDDQYSISRQDLIHQLQKVENLLNEKLTPLRTKPPGLDYKMQC